MSSKQPARQKCQNIQKMTAFERETILRELAEKIEGSWIPCYDTSKAGYGHLLMMLFDGKEYKYQIASWTPPGLSSIESHYGFFPIVWGLSDPILNNEGFAGYKPDNGEIEKLLEESGYYDYLYGVQIGV